MNKAERKFESQSNESDESDVKTETEVQEGAHKRSVAEYIKRYLVLIVGLVVMSFGVSFSITAQLGTSPVSSIPQVTAVMSGMSIGTTTVIVNTIIVLLQIAILRRRFKLIRLIQIPVCTVFGYLIDLANLCIAGIHPVTYWEQWLLCIAGIVLVGVGVAIEMAADVMTLAGEGLSQAISTVTRIKFGYAKVMVDVSFVVIAVVLSLCFLHRLEGVREGTVAAALFVGLIAKALNRFFTPAVNRICS